MPPALTLAAFDFPLAPDTPFTASMAAEGGLSRQRVHHLVQLGLLRRPMRGLYVGAHVPDSLELRCDMLRLVMPSDAYVADRTAAWLHGAQGALAPNEDLDIPRPSCLRLPASTRLRNGLVAGGRRSVRADELVEVNGVVATTPLRTALDLGRLQPTRDLRLAGMDAMLALGGFELDELLCEIPRFKGERGVVGLRLLAPLADAGAQSFGESALRLRWYDAGLPRPETQVPVQRPDGGYYYLDLGLDEQRFAAEYDGAAFHSSPEQHTHDADRRAWLRSQAGITLEALRSKHVFGRLQNAERILRDAWARHRARRGVPVVIS